MIWRQSISGSLLSDKWSDLGLSLFVDADEVSIAELAYTRHAGHARATTETFGIVTANTAKVQVVTGRRQGQKRLVLLAIEEVVSDLDECS